METTLTKKEAVRLHRILWNTIADILDKDGIPEDCIDASDLKRLAFIKMKERKEYEGPRPIMYCFCCAYEPDLNSGICNDYHCYDLCPIKWGYKSCGHSEYTRFSELLENNEIECASDMARTIANLPERPDQDFDIL